MHEASLKFAQLEAIRAARSAKRALRHFEEVAPLEIRSLTRFAQAGLLKSVRSYGAAQNKLNFERRQLAANA
jgi:hypothetical protein